MRFPFRRIIAMISMVSFLAGTSLYGNHPKPRIIITADPELDDNNSLIRFLLYSSSFQVEGLIYASSQFHWKGDGKGTKFMVPGREYTRYGLNRCPCESYRWKKEERFIHEAVEAYEKVYPSLRVHDRGYPTPALLKTKIKYGNIEFEGDFSKDTEGSDLIKSILLDNKPGPVYLTAWGGQSTIARALKSIEDEYQHSKKWEAVRKKVSAKAVLLPSGDQDGTYASYIQLHWPDIDYRQFRNGPNYGYGAQLVSSPENAYFLTAGWMTENITSRGPLGAIYRVWGDGKQMVKGDNFDYFGLDGYTNDALKKMGYIVWMPVQAKGSWLGEGDTGTFMNILSNGLEASDKENPGGWGGRPFYPDPARYIDPFSNDTARNKDLVISATSLTNLSNAAGDAVAFPDFWPAAQRDFAARMAWSVTPHYRLANHAPVITLKGKTTLQVTAGQSITLQSIIRDPDGDAYTIKWWEFKKDNKSDALQITPNESGAATLTIPRQAAPHQPFFVVVEVTDNGRIPLTTYQLVKLKW